MRALGGIRSTDLVTTLCPLMNLGWGLLGMMRESSESLGDLDTTICGEEPPPFPPLWSSAIPLSTVSTVDCRAGCPRWFGS